MAYCYRHSRFLGNDGRPVAVSELVRCRYGAGQWPVAFLPYLGGKRTSWLRSKGGGQAVAGTLGGVSCRPGRWFLKATISVARLSSGGRARTRNLWAAKEAA